jgi:glycosyltransferase involved in cell wall biosynthesis
VTSRGVRVVMDARPLQDPDRGPLTALYLRHLLGAYDAAPVEGESFALLLQSDLDDPTGDFGNLDIVGRRLLPPTRFLRSGAMTVDPILLRGASLGAAWQADRSGAAGAVYHTAGAGPIPIASGLPVVVTLLDLAPWEMPDVFCRSAAGRFGRRLRAQLLREAAAVIVGTEASARAATRLLHLKRDRIRVVPLAPRPAYAFWGASAGAAGTAGLADSAAELALQRDRLGLPDRYLVYPGRYDARQDLTTLLATLADLAAAGRPDGLAAGVPWPPRVVLVDATPEDRAALARAAAKVGVGEALTYAPGLTEAGRAALVRGARAAILPVVSEAAGLPVIEAIACGTPVVASSAGALPELVGGAGLLVEPRDPDRLAVALRAIWADDGVHGGVAAVARERAEADRRSWADVAAETRAIYAAIGTRAPAAAAQDA